MIHMLRIGEGPQFQTGFIFGQRAENACKFLLLESFFKIYNPYSYNAEVGRTKDISIACLPINLPFLQRTNKIL